VIEIKRDRDGKFLSPSKEELAKNVDLFLAGGDERGNKPIKSPETDSFLDLAIEGYQKKKANEQSL